MSWTIARAVPVVLWVAVTVTTAGGAPTGWALRLPPGVTLSRTPPSAPRPSGSLSARRVHGVT